MRANWLNIKQANLTKRNFITDTIKNAITADNIRAIHAPRFAIFAVSIFTLSAITRTLKANLQFALRAVSQMRIAANIAYDFFAYKAITEFAFICAVIAEAFFASATCFFILFAAFASAILAFENAI